MIAPRVDTISDDSDEDEDEVGPLIQGFSTGSTGLPKPRVSISAEAFGRFNPMVLTFIPIVIAKHDEVKEK